MMLIVGLGNKGEEYEGTRHNTGRIILENIAKSNDFLDWKNNIKINALCAKGEIDGVKFDFMLPESFMNNSGVAVSQVINDKKKLKNLVVIYDDMDLPLGHYKISYNKSSGGHNGLASIIKKVKSQEFTRIRIGVSPSTPTGKMKKPKGEDAVLKFLLGKYKEDELKEIKKVSKKVSEIIKMISEEGKDKAMTLFN